MKLRIAHHYIEKNGIEGVQFFTYENVTKILTEYQKNNGNSYWLHIFQDNGQIKTDEYFELDTEKNCYDILAIIQ